MFCEKCGIKKAENGNYCSSCSTTAKKTISWWVKSPTKNHYLQEQL